MRDFSWPQHSFPILRKQSEISMVIDLPELNDPFHFSNRLGKTIAGSSSFEDANAYGTFVDDAGGSSASTTTSSYPYALGCREPTVIFLGGCPACKVGDSFSPLFSRRFLVRLACWNRTSPVSVFAAQSSSFLWELSVVWPCDNVAVNSVVLFSSSISYSSSSNSIENHMCISLYI